MLSTTILLPKRCRFCTHKHLETVGIVFGEDVDKQFVHATLPTDWHSVETGYQAYSLLDDKSRIRAHVFAGNRHRHEYPYIWLLRRYHAMEQPVGGYDNFTIANHDTMLSEGVVTDHDSTVLWQSEPIVGITLQESNALRKIAEDWLSVHYPRWKDPTAYWD